MAVVCDPKALLKAAKCLPCLTPRQQRLAQASLFCRVAVNGIPGMPPSPPGFAYSTPTGFAVNSNLAGTQLTATWNPPAPPVISGLLSLQVWTSSDGVNYALFANVNPLVFSQNIGVVAVGSFLWSKIRWADTGGNVSNFTAPIEWSGQAMDWAQRVNTNGAAPTAAADILNVNNLWVTLVNAGLSSQILVLNPLIGTNNIIEMVTPLIKGAGADPWANHNFVNASCTINGLVGNASAGLFTSFIPTSFASDNNAGVSCYTTGANDGTNYTWGGYDGANGIMSLHANDAGSALFDCFNLANRSTVVSPALQGFYSVNRVAAADLRLYFANSTNAIAQVGATNVVAGSARSTINICVGGLALNNAGSGTLFNTQTISFWAATNGLSLGQATTLFNAVQAYRVAVGGGFA